MIKKVTSLDKIVFEVGEVSPVDFPFGVSSFLYEPNRINIAVKLEDIQEEEVDHFMMGLVSLSLQDYKKEIFNTECQCYSFGMSIGGLNDGLVFCNFNIAAKGFFLQELKDDGMGYGFNFFLVDENNIIKAIRKIGVNKDFSEVIYKTYISQTKENPNKKVYEQNLGVIVQGINNFGNKEVIEKFSVSHYCQG